MAETMQDMENAGAAAPNIVEKVVAQPSLAEAATAVGEMDAAAAEASAPSAEELAIARELVRSARARGAALTGPDGLLKALTKTVLETALDEEMTDHLGYDKHSPAGRGTGNSRNGTRTKTLLTDNVVPVDIEVPRDRDGSFTPVVVKKRQRRLDDVDTVVLSLVAKGLTTGEVAAHFEEVYGASLSKDTISRITDRVLTEMTEWMARPLELGWSTARCSSTRSTSRSATARSPIGPSTWRSGWTWPATRTCSGCGPAPAVVSRRSSGCRSSPNCATAASPMCSSWSATGSRDFRTR
jgi:hypothetical protein